MNFIFSKVHEVISTMRSMKRKGRPSCHVLSETHLLWTEQMGNLRHDTLMIEILLLYLHFMINV